MARLRGHQQALPPPAREAVRKGGLRVLPENSAAERGSDPTIEILWSSATLAHNLGMVTRSDAAKLRLLTKGPVDAPKILSPRGPDVWYAKNFLDDATETANGRVGDAATLLTELHTSDTTLFAPQARADELAKQFRVPVTVAGAAGTIVATRVIVPHVGTTLT